MAQAKAQAYLIFLELTSDKLRTQLRINVA